MMARNLLLLAMTMVIPSCASPRPRTAPDFEAISDAATREMSVPELTGFDPIKDWARVLWMQRAIDGDPNYGHPLFLPGVKQLTPDEIDVIFGMRAAKIFLPDLEFLDRESAERIAAHAANRYPNTKGKALHLDGLVSLDQEAAHCLVRYGADTLSLDSLTAITPDIARILAKTPGSLSLGALTSLDLETAHALATWKGWGEQVFLSLRGLKTLPPQIARALAACQGWGLDLSGLNQLRPAEAQALGKLDNPYLALDGLATIVPDTAKVISTWRRKFLSLDGLRSLDPALKSQIESGCELVSFRSL